MKKDLQLKDLFQKYLDNQYTEIDLYVLIGSFQDPEESIILKSLIRQDLEENATEDPAVASSAGKVVEKVDDQLFITLRKEQDLWKEQDKPEKQNNRSLFQRMAVAAIGLLLIGLAYSYWETVQNWVDPIEMQQVITATGERSTVELLDGTTVWLSPESSLSYPDKFRGSSREVILTGEAFFEVARDEDHPFVVVSGEISTTVLGTSFTICAYEDEETVTITLLKGAVAVEGKKDNQQEIKPVRLDPHQKAVFSKNTRQLAKEDAPEAQQLLARRDGIYEYDGQEVGAIIKDLQRQYKAVVRVEGNLDQRRYYGTLDTGKDITQFLEKLSLVTNTQWEKTGDEEYLIKSD